MSLVKLKESGFLESYIIGVLSDVELEQVESTLNEHPELSEELYPIEKSLEKYALAHAIPPEDATKPMLLATVDYIKRIEGGEAISNPPALHQDSKIVDFAEWLERPDLQEPTKYESMHGHIIGHSEEKTTLIVWLKQGAPEETHINELETFLVVEGTCAITIGDEVHHLKMGDVLMIPLYINHKVEVTSTFRCKIILERRAA